MTEKRVRIGIFIATEQRGFLASLGQVLSGDHEVWFIARDPNVRKTILEKMPECRERILTLSDYKPRVRKDNVTHEALVREERYGERFSMLMSYDRALGQGYLFNADRHPHIIKSLWPRERKLEQLLSEFMVFEHVFELVPFSLIICHARPVTLDLVSEYHGAKVLSPGLARYESNLIWFDNRFEDRERYRELVREYLRDEAFGGDDFSYKQYSHYTETAKKLAYSSWKAFKEAGYNFARDEVYARLRGFHKRDSYIFCGWVWPVLRSPRNYRYVAGKGVMPHHLREAKIVYFPLHEEPETALLRISPEFNNSMEIIAWVSKCLPANAALVVKENPWSFGIRSRRYYDNLRKMANVHLAHPGVPSHTWIRRSRLVVAITGTAGFEAVYFRRPVLSFGRHQVINELPTVRHVDSFSGVRENMDALLGLEEGDEIFARARYALHKAMLEISFPLPGYEERYHEADLCPHIAGPAARRLYEEFPDLLGNG